MAETAIAVWEPDQQEMDMYRRHYAPKGTTDEEWEIFLETCRAYRVSPIRRQIYLVGRYDSTKKHNVNTPQVSIGTLRLMALRTQEFEGTTEPEWADEDGAWYTCWPKFKGKHPYAARVGVYRKGFRKPVWGIVYFHEVAQTADVWENGRKTGEKRFTKFWEDSGIHQLAKCAEADALRKAFEEECGGAYIHEEMLQADSDRPPVSVIPVVEADDAETNEALQETAQATQPKTKAQKPIVNGDGTPAFPEQAKPAEESPLTLSRVKMYAKNLGLAKDQAEWSKLLKSMYGRDVADLELKDSPAQLAIVYAELQKRDKAATSGK